MGLLEPKLGLSVDDHDCAPAEVVFYGDSDLATENPRDVLIYKSLVCQLLSGNNLNAIDPAKDLP